MYAQIVIECQTQTENVSCEFCIANKTCQLRKNDKKDEQATTTLEVKIEQSASSTLSTIF